MTTASTDFKIAAKDLCDLVWRAHQCNLPGTFSGSAFRDHPKFLHRDGLILKNCWNVNDYCEIYILSDPAATLFVGCQNPSAYGNPNPYPSSGKLVEVYSTGQWLIEGPWQPVAVALMEKIAAECEEAEERMRVEKAARAQREKEERAAREEALRASFVGAQA